MEGIDWSLAWWHPRSIAHPHDGNEPSAEIAVEGVTYTLRSFQR